MHVIRGETSDLLTADIAARMQAVNPAVEMTVLGDIGHAPTMTRDEDIALLRDVISRLDRGQ